MRYTAITIIKKYTQQSNVPTRIVVLFGLCAVVCYVLGALTVTLVSQQTPNPVVIEEVKNE